MEKNIVIAIEGLSKKYQPKLPYAITNINLLVYEQEIVGIVGKNGAGKSTTIKALTGIHPFNEGKIEICGHDIKSEPIEAKMAFGYVPDTAALFEKMTGFEYINFMANIYGVKKEDALKRIEDFQEFFHLDDDINRQISSYSHGMRQKISIMSSLIHEPKAFILDEPMVGLDPQTALAIKKYILLHKEKGNSVLFCSHNLDVIEKLCDRAYIIDEGKILEMVNMEEFRKDKNLNFEQYFLDVTSR